MKEKLYRVEPFEVKFLGEVEYIAVSIENYNVGSSDVPNMTIKIYSNTLSKVYELKAEMPPEIYSDWGTDDEVVIDYVCEILQLQRAAEE